MILLLLSGCQSNLKYEYEFEAPNIEEYRIYEIEYSDLKPSAIDNYDDIDNENLLNATKANIYIENNIVNNYWIFSIKVIYSGSGVIFFESDLYYYALTNAHVVDNHRFIEVIDYFDNRYNAFIYEGSVNYELDLAILVFSKDSIELSVMSLAYGEVLIGEAILAIGNPLGERNVISIGKVIGYNKTKVKGRYGKIKTNEFYSIIHSAKTNPGSSGGMLLNFDLEIVGINFAGDRNESDAVSSKMVVDYINSNIINITE